MALKEETKQKTKWKKTEPERNGPYLVRINTGQYFVAKWFMGIGWQGRFHNSVIAWMDIPKYEEEKV